MSLAARVVALRRDGSQDSSASVLRTLVLSFGVTILLDSFLPLILRLASPGSNVLGLLEGAAMVASLALGVRIVVSRKLGWPELGGFLVIAVMSLLDPRNPMLPRFDGPAMSNLLVAIVIGLRGRPGLLIAFVTSVAPLVLDPSRGSSAWRVRVDLGILQVGMMVAGAVVVNAIFAAAATSDQLATQLEEVSLRREVTRARDARREVVRRVLHDDVLTALRSVVEGSAPTQQVAATCGEAVVAIREVMADDLHTSGAIAGAESGHGPGGRSAERTAAGLATLALRGSLLDVSTTVREGPPPSRAVADALVQAAREALRNIERHAGVGRAEVAVDFSGGDATVVVRDDGRGIDAKASAGVGITTSIRSRLHEVGGEAQMWSQGGIGTRWTLSGPAGPAATSSASAAPKSRDYLDVQRARLVVGVGVPLLLANTWLASQYVRDDAAILLETALAVAMTLSALLVMALLRWRPPGLAAIIGFALAQAMMLGLHMWGAGFGAASGFRSWGASYSALPLVILAFFTTWRRVAVMVVPYVLTQLLVVAVDPVATLGSSTGFMASSIVIPLSGFLGHRLRTSWGQVERARERVHAARIADEQRASMEAVRSEYLDTLVDEVLPFLVSVHRGDSDPEQPQVRAEGKRLGQVTRDDIYAPGFFPQALRQAVTDFRSRGGVVDIRPGCSPGTGKRLPGLLLAALVAGGGPCGRRIRLTYMMADPPQVRFTIVPPLSSVKLRQVSASAALGSVVWEADDFATVLYVSDRTDTEKGSDRSDADRKAL